MAMEKERMAIGVRRPGRPEIEYAVMRNGVGDRLMPILADRYVRDPNRVFADMIPDRRLIKAKNGMEFHDGARQAGVQRWVIHQLDEWHDGLVKPKHPASLRTRWQQTAAAHGASRFVVMSYSLSHIEENGIQRNCIMGAAIELFRDDYPASIVPVSTSIHHRDLESCNWRYVSAKAPDVVVQALGLHDGVGSFQLMPSVTRAIGRHCGIPPERVTNILELTNSSATNLVRLNDRTRNWPMLAAIMDDPSAEVFRRT